MENRKREFLKLAGLTSIKLPLFWSTTIVSSVSLPIHAMTSNEVDPDTETCSSFSEERVDESISISVTSIEVVGPVVAQRNGLTFLSEVTVDSGDCADGNGAQSQTITFSGTIDETNAIISGRFDVTQFCANQVQCEQIATFTASKISGSVSSIEGNFEGRVVGTLRCCDDLN